MINSILRSQRKWRLRQTYTGKHTLEVDSFNHLKFTKIPLAMNIVIGIQRFYM